MISGYFQKIGRAGDLDHHCVMTHKLHADAGNEKLIALLAMNQETQMKTLSYNDAVVAPTVNAITPGERHTGTNMRINMGVNHRINHRVNPKVSICHSYIIR